MRVKYAVARSEDFVCFLFNNYVSVSCEYVRGIVANISIAQNALEYACGR